MNLGEVINKYIEEHDISMRQFADRANMSAAYVSMLINGRKDGSKPKPSIGTYQLAATAMGMSVGDLLTMVDDIVVVNEHERPAVDVMLEKELLDAFSELSERDKRLVIQMAKGMASK